MTISGLTLPLTMATGFGIQAQNYIETLLLFSDVLCLQEHFLLDCKSRKSSNRDKIRSRFSDRYDMFIEPATKDNTQVSRGRGKGGLAILWNKKFTKYVTKVKSTNSRLRAMKFLFPANYLLVINVYLPCDPR